jgi:hypothetical protein
MATSRKRRFPVQLPQIGRPRHSTIVAYVALFLSLSGTAYAATGGSFILGQTNKAGTLSTVQRTTTNGAALRVLTRQSSNPPFVVNGTGKVANLNADRLDGLDSTALRLGGFTPLTMTNTWAGNCIAGGEPGFARVGNVVYLHGEMCGLLAHQSESPFTLPVSVRPTKTVTVTTTQCSGATGRMVISPTGTVRVDPDPQDGTSAQCSVSFSGVFYTLPY